MNKWIAIAVVITAASAVIAASSINMIESQQPTTVLDSTTLLLDFKRIQGGDYIVLYSTSPKLITSGTIVAKLPCDENSDPDDWMLLGGIRTDLSPIAMDLIQGSPGNLCSYVANIPNESTSSISGLVLVNTDDREIRLPRTSSIVITVHSVSAP